MKARPVLQRNRCNATFLDSSIGVQPLWINTKSLNQGLEGPGALNDSDYSSVAILNMVPRVASNVSGKPFGVASNTESSLEWEQRETPPNTGKQPMASGVESFRKSLINIGLSGSAASLISNYDSSWSKFVSWCTAKQIDLIQCSINFVLNFLA